MPLCGTKKSKKQKRDPSPPYAARQIEEAKENADREVRAVKAEKERLDGELRELRRENSHLAEQNADVKKIQERLAVENEELKAKLKDAETKVTAEADKVNTAELGTKLQEITIQIDEERQQKKALFTAKEQLQNDVARANKTLETERNQRTKAEAERDKYKKEKEVVEKDLSLIKKELEEVKKENSGPRSPTREPTEEWEAKIKQAESEVTQERNQRLEKERELSRLLSDNKLLLKDKEETEAKLQIIQSERSTNDEAMSDMQKNIENIERTFEGKLSKYERENTQLKQKLQETDDEKDKLLSRLSAITAAQVKENNPNFSDLSDPNRPEKLGEQMSLLYDDQWTDATEALADLKLDDDAVVKTLLDILIDIYEHCKEAAADQLSRVEEYMFLPPIEGHGPISPEENGTDHQPKSPPASKIPHASRIPRLHSQKARPALSSLTSPDKKENDVHDISKQQKSKKSMTFPRGKGEKVPEVPVEVKRGIKDFRKTVFKQVVPVVEREISNKLRNRQDIGNEVVNACKNYITRCVELCWLMRIQDPPCVLNWSTPSDKLFNTDMYKFYLTTGQEVAFIVWPAMYLYEGGPLMMKGIAEGKKV